MPNRIRDLESDRTRARLAIIAFIVMSVFVVWLALEDFPADASTTPAEVPEGAIRLPSTWDSEDVVLFADTPSGWTSESMAYTMSFASDELDPRGIARFTPEGAPADSITGLTVRGIDSLNPRQSNALAHIVDADGASYATIARDRLLLASTFPEGQPTGEPTTVEIGGRGATSDRYFLADQYSMHLCEERLTIVNAQLVGLRMCSPTGGEEMPKNYSDFFESLKWVARDDDIPSPGLETVAGPRRANAETPDHWNSAAHSALGEELKAGIPKPARNGGIYVDPLFTVVDYAPAIVNGTYSTVTVDEQDPANPCNTDPSLWNTDGVILTRLEDRTIGDLPACGFSGSPTGSSKPKQWWFVPDGDALHVITIRTAPKVGAPSDNAQEEHPTAEEEYATALGLLDKVTWSGPGSEEK